MHATNHGLHGEYRGIGPLDEYPIHQIPAPVTWAGSSDRNFYDRCYLNAHDRTGDVFLITGLGFYPNLGTKDAYVLLGSGDRQTGLHFGDAADPKGGDRLDQRVGNYRIEVVKPLETLRLIVEETNGIAVDMTWNGNFEVLQEVRHIMRQGVGTTLDAQRFAQVGSWEGVIKWDDRELKVDPAVWTGSRDRSWGIRPVGEGAVPGKPAEPDFQGMWWLYVPIGFDDFWICLIIQETPDGYRTVNDCTRVWKDGRVEQLGWPRVDIHYREGTRITTGATIECTNSEGKEIVFEVFSKFGMPIHVGGGYGGDSDWGHGHWKGADFVERIDYDMTDPAVKGRIPFGVTDHVGGATVSGPGAGVPDGSTGWGLYEHGVLGRHDPSGFKDWFDRAL